MSCAAYAQRADPSPAASENPPVQLKIDPAAFRGRAGTSSLGLKPPSSLARNNLELPFGMNYSRDTRSLLMPLDEKDSWGIGLNLNLNRQREAEAGANGLGLQPKRAPGVVIHRKF